jgi:transposase-like protein
VSDPIPVLSAVPTAPAERGQFWRQAVAAFESSGLSVREFCRQRGLHERRFYTWRKSLGLSPVDARPTAPVSGAPPVPGFVPVRLVADTAAEVVLPNGLTVRLPVSSDPAHVARLVAALRGAPC